MPNGIDATIDRLVIEISTNLQKSDISNVYSLNESLIVLQETIEKGFAGLDSVSNALNTFSKISSQTSSVVQASTAIMATAQTSFAKETQTSMNSATTAVLNLQKQYDELLSKIPNLTGEELKNALNQAEILSSKINRNFSKVSASAQQTEVAVTGVRNETEKLSKSSEKATFGWDKLVLSIKRIAFYRTVRRAIQLLGKEILTAISNFAQFDEVTNQSISNLQSSWKAFGNSVGIVISQLINTAAPLLIYILRIATDVANAISLIFATISGEEYYSKAIEYQTNYAEALKKTNEQLLDFDKFNVLQRGIEPIAPEDMFDTEEVATGWAEMSGTTLALISALETLVAIKLVTWATEGFLAITKLATGMATAEGATKALSIATNALLFAGIFALIFGIQYLVTNWDNLSNTMRAVGISILALVATFTIAILLVKLGLLGLGAALASTGIFAIIIAIGLAIYLLYENWDTVVKFLKTTARQVGQWFVDLWNIIKKVAVGFANAFISAINFVIKSFEVLINGIIDGLNFVIKGLNKIPGVDIDLIAHVQWQIPKVQYFAQGGIVPDTRGGNAFIMNEQGIPEALTRNDKNQIEVQTMSSMEESSYRGTLMALRQHAMETQGNGNGVAVSVELKPDGNALARALNPYIRQENVRTSR